MQDVFIEKPYEFVPPCRGTFFANFIRDWKLFTPHLKKHEGVVGFECRNVDRLTDSIEQGHSILAAPNHSRTADPLVMGWLAGAAHCHFYAMGSWHLFNQSKLISWAINKMGAFSVNREGVDRASLTAAIDLLTEAERPLIVFPEGTTSRTNDRLMALLDGVAFIARSAAKKRAKHDGGKVVMHPIAMKYRFHGDLEKAVVPVLTEIEEQFTWKPQTNQPILARISRIGNALLSLKEIEYMGEAKTGTFPERQERLINRLLQPLEKKLLGSTRDGDGVVSRIKGIRMKIFPEITKNRVAGEQLEQYWDHIADTYLAQQVSLYPQNYLQEHATVDRVLETVERFEEDLTDKARVHGELSVIIDVCPAIEVPAKRDKSQKTDPIMSELQRSLQSQLDQLAKESPKYPE